MNNVIELTQPEKEEMAVTCDCGCVSFLVITTGEIECTSCGERMDDDLTGISTMSVAALPGDTAVQVRTIHVTADFAFKQTISQASEAHTNAVIIINENGDLLTWSKGWETEEQKQWYQGNIDKVMGIIGEVSTVEEGK